MVNLSKQRWTVDLTGPFLLGGDVVAVEALSEDGKHIEREICTVMLDTDAYPNGAEFLEDVAIARLIACAPELLAAAIAATSLKTRGKSMVALNTRIEADQMLRAAIAKAQGETP